MKDNHLDALATFEQVWLSGSRAGIVSNCGAGRLMSLGVPCAKLSNRMSMAEWKKEKVDLWQRARKEAINILQSHQSKPLEKEKRGRMRNRQRG